MKWTETCKHMKGKKEAEDQIGVWTCLPKIFFRTFKHGLHNILGLELYFT